jgi:hypothetical protein
MKVFAANPIIAVLAGIVAAFLALKESLSRTEEGQAKLTKITEGFTKIMNGLFAVLEPIAMLFADLIGNLLSNEKVMNGLAKTVGVLTGVFTGLYGSLFAVGEFIVNTLINNFKILIGVAKGAGDVIAVYLRLIGIGLQKEQMLHLRQLKMVLMVRLITLRKWVRVLLNQYPMDL